MIIMKLAVSVFKCPKSSNSVQAGHGTGTHIRRSRCWMMSGVYTMNGSWSNGQLELETVVSVGVSAVGTTRICSTSVSSEWFSLIFGD